MHKDIKSLFATGLVLYLIMTMLIDELCFLLNKGYFSAMKLFFTFIKVLYSNKKHAMY